jgi:uncharacterized membrane protein
VKHFERAKRSVAKTITYRILIIIATYIVVYLMTHDIETTSGVTFVTSVVNTGLYFAHERVWNKIHWGKHK